MDASRRFCISMIAGILAFAVLTETGAVEPYHAGWYVDGIDMLVITQGVVWLLLLLRYRGNPR